MNSFVIIIVIIWTMNLFASIELFARIDFKISGMILLFLPAMTMFAAIVLFTSIEIRPNEIVNMPIRTQVSIVIVNVGLSSEILPVMSIHTAFFVVVIAPGAP